MSDADLFMNCYNTIVRPDASSAYCRLPHLSSQTGLFLKLEQLEYSEQGVCSFDTSAKRHRLVLGSHCTFVNYFWTCKRININRGSFGEQITSVRHSNKCVPYLSNAQHFFITYIFLQLGIFHLLCNLF